MHVTCFRANSKNNIIKFDDKIYTDKQTILVQTFDSTKLMKIWVFFLGKLTVCMINDFQ